MHVTVFCSVPRRYGIADSDSSTIIPNLPQISVKRFLTPYLGNGPISSLLSYVFYFLQALPALFLRPNIIVGTSAKLLTSFIAACASRIIGAYLFIDFRDTFSDNFFYFYRWHKRILLQSIIMAIENIVLRSARSINMVSIGFQDAFAGWDRILSKYSISFTNFSNGIDYSFRQRIFKATSSYKSDCSVYRITHAGNIGIGQQLIGLLKDLALQPDLVEYMLTNRIRFDIYGSGAQLSELQSLIAIRDTVENSGPLANVVRYCGVIPRKDVETIYSNSDCLMLQLGRYSSLSMVIPSKIFEYAANPYLIVFELQVLQFFHKSDQRYIQLYTM